MDWCLWPCVTLPGYCPGLLAVEQHQRLNLNYDCHITCAPIYPSSPIETTKLTWLGMCAHRSWEWEEPLISIKLVWKPQWSKNQTILTEGLDWIFKKKGPFRELEFYQCVAKNCSGYNHPPKFCLAWKFQILPQILWSIILGRLLVSRWFQSPHLDLKSCLCSDIHAACSYFDIGVGFFHVKGMLTCFKGIMCVWVIVIT